LTISPRRAIAWDSGWNHPLMAGGGLRTEHVPPREPHRLDRGGVDSWMTGASSERELNERSRVCRSTITADRAWKSSASTRSGKWARSPPWRSCTARISDGDFGKEHMPGSVRSSPTHSGQSPDRASRSSVPRFNGRRAAALHERTWSRRSRHAVVRCSRASAQVGGSPENAKDA